MESSQQPAGRFTRKSTAEEVTAGIDLQGQTALVTGCNSGIGYETMRVLALRGARVIGTARTMETAAAACASVAGSCLPMTCELTDLDSVTRCAADVAALGVPLDMLICNAGVMMTPRLELVRGIEKQFATNYVGHFLLVNRLLERVRDAPAGRIVVLTSEAHRKTPSCGIQFDNLSGELGYSRVKAYGQSKLADLLLAVSLVGRLSGTRATANAVHPGVILTPLWRHTPAFVAPVLRVVMAPYLKSVPQGAATTCYVATSPALSGVSGRYFADCDVKPPSAHGTDAALAERLWSVSERLVAGYL